MRSIIEVSAYLIIMALICLVGIDFITMNMRVSKVNEVVEYIEDYIEVHGVNKTENEIDEQTFANVERYANMHNMSVSYIYDGETAHYSYYKVSLKYKIGSALFSMKKEHIYDSLVRVAKEED